MRSTATQAASRRRRRRKVAWGPVLWLAVVANIVLGLMFSQSTSARKVRVVGAAPGDYGRIEQHLQVLRAIPAIRTNSRQIVGLVQANDQVESASFSQNVFGRGLLRIKLRTPVAKLKTSRPVYLSDRGKLYFSATAVNGLPSVALPPDALSLNATLLGAWDLASVADLCRRIPEVLPKGPWFVELSRRGMISLYRDARCRVVLGATDGLDAKVVRLRKILDDRPDLLDQVRELNLTAADNPSVTPLTDQ